MAILTKKNQDIVKVLVDTKEQKMTNKSLVFFKKQGIFVEKNANPDGDLIFILKNKKMVFIERKSYSDLVTSYIKNHHIQDQAVRLSKYDYYACIVHGNIFDLKKNKALSRITQDSVNKMITNLMLFYKLPIFFVENENQYLKLSLLIANTVAKHHGKELSSVNLVGGLQSRPDIGILAAQKDIGVKKAELLLNEFGSPSAVLNASREDLLQVKGIGDAMVANIKELKKIYEEGMQQ